MNDLARRLNSLPPEAAAKALGRCCGSQRWVAKMLARRPFTDTTALHQAADDLWWRLTPEDWLEAFSHHPRIGDRQLRGAAEDNRAWSSGEQAGASRASSEVQQALIDGNRRYEARFGHVFLICASGLSGQQMLAELERRLGNEAAEELRHAAGEQAKITRLRLDKLTAELES